MERRLAAIVAADVVGYSSLMGRDETGTLEAVQAHFRELIEPKVAQYRGRIVKLIGDGALFEFPGVGDAVRFAVEVQAAIPERDAAMANRPPIAFRIGINLGDIITEGGDIFGDGVNVAARLEALSEPGGICISRSARDQIRDRLELTLEDLGEIQVKNIARPVRVFRIVLDDKAKSFLTPVASLRRSLDANDRPPLRLSSSLWRRSAGWRSGSIGPPPGAPASPGSSRWSSQPSRRSSFCRSRASPPMTITSPTASPMT